MIKLKDALQERALIDRWGFVGFAVVGGLAIWIAKQTTDWDYKWIAGGAALLLVLYAIIVATRGTGKLRSDQAGDNCYYLGLIYTLVSLAHAIFTFDPADTATTIVQGFGIALLTTIVGLTLRVFFNQSRVDLYEAEDTARLELAEAAARLKTQLSQIANSFRDFAFGMQQSIDELRQAATTSISEAADESVRAIKDLSKSAGTGLKNQTTGLTERVAELTEATTNTCDALKSHAKSLDALTKKQISSTENLEAMERSVANASAMSDALRAQMESASEVQSNVEAAATRLNDVIGGLQSSVDGTSAALQQLHGEFQERLAELEKGPQSSLDGALKAIAGAAERLKDALESLASQHQEASRSLEGLSSGVVVSLQNHNREMEDELKRSREKVGKVQNFLVDMTNTLAQQIEHRPAQ